MASVLLFAGLREHFGTQCVVVELDDGATVTELFAALTKLRPSVGPLLSGCRVAVDQAFIGTEGAIPSGAEIAVIPPVSGGHDGPAPPRVAVRGSHCELREAALSLDEVVGVVTHAGAGGISTFTGNVRRQSRGKTVHHLEYEAYPPMAVAAMDAIASQVEQAVPGVRVALQHRVGHLEIGDSAVVIAASAPHRAEAFAACREVIERLKREVPIWKKEFDDDGAAWIGHGP